MLTQATRPEFNTLLDAVTLRSVDDARPAIVYVETGRPPIVITRRDFRRAVLDHAAALQRMGI
ncbi:MAG TPA: hypothetical protein VFL17_14080, partial [Anaerolineae bacterium]|nr:hypothetical protein [Anaerolineae bacterium]